MATRNLDSMTVDRRNQAASFHDMIQFVERNMDDGDATFQITTIFNRGSAEFFIFLQVLHSEKLHMESMFLERHVMQYPHERNRDIAKWKHLLKAVAIETAAVISA